MANIVEISDFDGQFKISTDQYTEANFEAIRDAHQFDLIYEMLGATLGQAFIDDLDVNGVPVNPLFTALYEAFVLDNESEIVKSIGIKVMVRNYLFVKYARENQVLVAMTGNQESKQENSDSVKSITWLVNKYNDAISTAQTIQWYIGENSAAYPDYNGQEMEFMSIY